MQSNGIPEISSIYNYHRWRSDVASAGQPELEELESLAGKGFDWIVNIGLVDTDYALEDEAGLVTAMGLRYSHIPVIFEAPTLEDFDRFTAIMDTSEGHKRFVHCAANYRASVFIALYLHLFKNDSYEHVMNQVYDIWQPDRVWQVFISRLLERYAAKQAN